MTLCRLVCTVQTASNGANNFKSKNLRVSRGCRSTRRQSNAFDGRRAVARRGASCLLPPHLTETVRPNSIACVTGSCTRASARVVLARAWRKERSEEHPQDDRSGHLCRRARCGAIGPGDRNRECGQCELGCRCEVRV